MREQGEGWGYLRNGMLSSSFGHQLIERVDISDEVEEILGRVSNKSKLILTKVWSRADHVVAALDKLHAKHVLPGFTDRTAEEREIERQTQDITRVSPPPG